MKSILIYIKKILAKYTLSTLKHIGKPNILNLYWRDVGNLYIFLLVREIYIGKPSIHDILFPFHSLSLNYLSGHNFISILLYILIYNTFKHNLTHWRKAFSNWWRTHALLATICDICDSKSLYNQFNNVWWTFLIFSLTLRASLLSFSCSLFSLILIWSSTVWNDLNINN